MNDIFSRIARIAQVTLALTAASAAAGAILGVGVFAGLGLLFAGFSGLRDTLEYWPQMAAIGGVLGAVLGPSLAWLLLRHVSLGRAFAHCMLGGIAGLLVGLAIPNHSDHDLEVLPIMVAILGTISAAVLLRLRQPRRKPSLPHARVPDPVDHVPSERDTVR